MSQREIVVTLDLGGSGAKAHAFDAAGGGHLASTACAYPPPGEDPGLFDPEEWWAAAARSLRLLVEHLGEPACSFAGVTVSAIRIPTVLVDRHGELAGPSILNTERRGERILDEVVAAIGWEKLYALTGHWPTAELGLAKLLWARAKLPEVWRRTAKVLQLHDWLSYRLSGVMASEPSSAAMSQLLAVDGMGWASEVLDAAGIDPSLLPELVPAGTRLGGLSGGVASATGLPAGLPVHAGGGDTHVSALSAAGTRSGPVVVAGTTTPAQVTVFGLPPLQQRFPVFTSAHLLAGHYALESNAGSTAGVLAALQGLDDMSGDTLAAALVSRGFALEASSGPLDVLAGNPFFSPEQWSNWPPPTVVGLRPSHSGADVRRAGIIGVAYAVRGIVEVLDRSCGTTSLPLVLTGGMSANRDWDQLVAEVCCREVLVRRPEAVAGLAGAALVSGCDADELVTSVPECRLLPSEDPAFEEGYRTYVDRYRTALERQRAVGGGRRAAGEVSVTHKGNDGGDWSTRGVATSIAMESGKCQLASKPTQLPKFRLWSSLTPGSSAGDLVRGNPM